MKGKLLLLFVVALLGIGIFTASSLHIDGDSLSLGQELQHQTLPTSADTDGDGFPDGLEVNPPPQLHNKTDPLRKDVFVEVDSVEGASLSLAEEQQLKTEFASAPAHSVGDEPGITLHILRDETDIPTDGGTSYSAYRNSLYGEHFDRLGYGYHHVLIVQDAQPGRSNVLGVANTRMHGVIVEDSEEPHKTGETMMHELGHSLGLTPNVYTGIDAASRPAEYPSVMNYAYPNCESDCPVNNRYQYSSGPGFNDWDYIEDKMRTPSIARLEATGD